MRIHNDGTAGPAASQAVPVDGAAQPGSTTRASSISGSGADQVEISSLSGNIAASVAGLAGRQAARVSQLAAQYAKGDYHVNALQLSRALVSGALAGGSVEEGG